MTLQRLHRTMGCALQFEAGCDMRRRGQRAAQRSEPLLWYQKIQNLRKFAAKNFEKSAKNKIATLRSEYR
jgi:hypothetical protein